MTTDEKIAVLQAHKAGKEIQYKSNWESGSFWRTKPIPHFNFFDFDYRVKPEPQEFWVNVWSSTSFVHGTWSAAQFQSKYGRAAGFLKTIHVREVL